MEFEKIKAIIEKEYECHNSLDLCGGMRRHNTVYFYNKEEFKEWIEKIELAQGVLTSNTLQCGVEYIVDLSEMTKCLIKCMEVERRPHKYLIIGIFYIGGMKLSFYKKRKSIKLMPFIAPSFRMKIRDDGEVSTNGEKWLTAFNHYYEDLELNQYGKVRKTIAKILDYIGHETGRYILRDVGRAVDSSGFFVLKRNLRDICKFNNLNQYFKSISDCELPRNLNKRDMNSAHILLFMKDFVKKGDEDLLFNLSDKKINRLSKRGIDEWDTQGRRLVQDFVGKYYADRIGDECYSVAYDYAGMCVETGLKITLRKNSRKKLKELHDNLITRLMSDEYNLDNPMTREDTRFANLRKLLPEEFIWIDAKGALYMEGARQHNCIFSYRSKIEADICAIYHWSREGRHYTLEFGIQYARNESGRYVLKQMKQRFNKDALEEDVKLVEQLLDKQVDGYAGEYGDW